MSTLLFPFAWLLNLLPPQPLAFSVSEPNLLSPQRPAQTSVFLSRRLPTPNGLQESIPLRQSVQAVVTLSAAAHKATERVDLVLAGVAARLVDFADADLYGGVIFGFDDAVCRGTLAGNVAVVRKGLGVSL